MYLSRFSRYYSVFKPRPILQPVHRPVYTSSRFCSSSSSSSSSSDSSDPVSDPDPGPIVPSTSSTSPTHDAKSSSESIAGRRPTPEKRDLLSIPLFTRPHFPKIIAPIIVHDPAACKAFTSLRDTGLRHVGLFLHKQAGLDTGPPGPEVAFNDAEQLHRVGVLAEVIRVATRQKGVELTFLCHHRIRWKSVLSSDPLLTLATEPVLEPPADISSELIKAYSLSVIETMKELLRLGSFYKEQLELLLESVDVNNPYHLADLGACLTTADPASLQDVLEETDIAERLRLTLELLKKDLETTRVSRRIHKQIEENVSKSQRRYFLTEQMKQIKRELGMERDEKETLISKFKARLEEKTVPQGVSAMINDEIEKLSSLEPSSSEYNVTRNYLDWLTELPWGVHSADSLDISRAEEVLNEMHYGLNDVKERILEFIAVSQLRGNVQGKILLLSGPPGVGKTSIGRSVAHALNREFYRFSVGGMGDVAEIKGHRRTYVGAMPGKFVQALKSCRAANPVIMIDEIDKMGRGWTGDPASALLEALDPEQNTGFVDHYLDVPVDLSKVLFLCTANVLDTIPSPLLDRMQSIPLSGYILEEKVAIAQKYLVPTALEDAGLNESDVTISESALQSLARDYCREAGVRNLKQQIEKIFRKVALKRARQKGTTTASASESSDDDSLSEVIDKEDIASEISDGDLSSTDKSAEIVITNEEQAPAVASDDAQEKKVETELQPDTDVEDEPHFETISITADNIEEFLGKKVFSKDRLYEETPPGIATGLAWTSMGGATLYIEVIQVDRSGTAKVDKSTITTDEASSKLRGVSLKITGRLGDVMKESAEIALSYARNYLSSSTSSFFEDAGLLHLHVPEGATPKDGPSAGCTIVTALLSLATGKPVRQHVAMTGEVTLTGQVLPVGGIREKAVAAKRSGIKQIILPEGNRKDWDELPSHVSDDLEPHFASHYDDVYCICFSSENEHGDDDQRGQILSDRDILVEEKQSTTRRASRQ